MLLARAFAAGLIELRQELAHIRRRLHHLVGGRQVGPAPETEYVCNLLTSCQQVQQDLLVRRVGARVVGQEHPLPQQRTGSKRHHRLHFRLVGGQRDFAIRVHRMACDVVDRQSLEFFRRRLNDLSTFLNVAAELEPQSRSLLVQGLEAVARGLVLVHAGQPVLQQRALHIMARRRADTGQVNSSQRIVNLAVQAQGAGGHGNALRLLLRLIANGLVGSHGIEDAGLRTCETQLFQRGIIEAQRVFRGVLSLDTKQCLDGRFMRGDPFGDPGSQRFSGLRCALFPSVPFAGDCGGICGIHSGKILQPYRVPH